MLSPRRALGEILPRKFETDTMSDSDDDDKRMVRPKMSARPGPSSCLEQTVQPVDETAPPDAQSQTVTVLENK